MDTAVSKPASLQPNSNLTRLKPAVANGPPPDSWVGTFRRILGFPEKDRDGVVEHDEEQDQVNHPQAEDKLKDDLDISPQISFKAIMTYSGNWFSQDFTEDSPIASCHMIFILSDNQRATLLFKVVLRRDIDNDQPCTTSRVYYHVCDASS